MESSIQTWHPDILRHIYNRCCGDRVASEAFPCTCKALNAVPKHLQTFGFKYEYELQNHSWRVVLAGSTLLCGDKVYNIGVNPARLLITCGNLNNARLSPDGHMLVTTNDANEIVWHDLRLQNAPVVACLPMHELFPTKPHAGNMIIELVASEPGVACVSRESNMYSLNDPEYFILYSKCATPVQAIRYTVLALARDYVLSADFNVYGLDGQHLYKVDVMNKKGMDVDIARTTNEDILIAYYVADGMCRILTLSREGVSNVKNVPLKHDGIIDGSVIWRSSWLSAKTSADQSRMVVTNRTIGRIDVVIAHNWQPVSLNFGHNDVINQFHSVSIDSNGNVHLLLTNTVGSRMQCRVVSFHPEAFWP